MNNEIIKARVLLSKTMEIYNDLLDQLEIESAQLNAYDKEKFSKRLAVLDDFCTIVLHYDDIVQKNLRIDPGNDKRNQEQLKIAKKYIERLGGDWSNVIWGKLSDY
jgi:hypothetical protein